MPQADDQSILRDFLAERDVRCPACDYSLRGLTGSSCPECSSPIRLTIDHGPLYERGSGPPLVSLAWAAIALTALAAALRTIPLFSLVFHVGGGIGGVPWLHAILRSGIVVGAIALALLAGRARTQHEQRAVVIWGALVLAIASGVVESLLVALALARIQI
jgi:hypothetical protein